VKTILTVLGARPQFIKASVVSAAIRASGVLREVVVHTGQHFDANMSDVFFAELGMRQPDHSLGIHGGSHGEMTGRMLIELEKVLQAERPHAVLVYGDTNSTLAGALTAVKLHIALAHVEAGLRSFNLAMPEEVNRIVADSFARWLFTPTIAAERNLAREGVRPERVFPVGDVMYDVALHHGARVGAGGPMLDGLKLARGGYVLATIHRAENTDHPQRLGAIVDALVSIATRLPVVWPVHPRTRGALQGRRSQLPAALHLIDPVGYLGMVELEKFAAVIATDSGGVQKEAFFHRVPCVTLRDETEWVELLEGGWNRLAPPSSSDRLAEAVLAAVGSSGSDIAPYGTGDAAQRIVAQLAADLPAT